MISDYICTDKGDLIGYFFPSCGTKKTFLFRVAWTQELDAFRSEQLPWAILHLTRNFPAVRQDFTWLFRFMNSVSWATSSTTSSSSSSSSTAKQNNQTCKTVFCSSRAKHIPFNDAQFGFNTMSLSLLFLLLFLMVMQTTCEKACQCAARLSPQPRLCAEWQDRGSYIIGFNLICMFEQFFLKSVRLSLFQWLTPSFISLCWKNTSLFSEHCWRVTGKS